MSRLPEIPSFCNLPAVELAAQCRDLIAWLERDDIRWTAQDRRRMVATAIGLLNEAASRIAPDEHLPHSPEFLIARGAASVSKAYQDKYELDAQASRCHWIHRAASRVLGANGEHWLRGQIDGRSRLQVASASAEGFSQVVGQLERICHDLKIRPVAASQS